MPRLKTGLYFLKMETVLDLSFKNYIFKIKKCLETNAYQLWAGRDMGEPNSPCVIFFQKYQGKYYTTFARAEKALHKCIKEKTSDEISVLEQLAQIP